MADFPTMPLRTDALLADTTHLSAAEFGGYMRLLVAMWRNGAKLPDDDARLMRSSGMTPREWSRSRAIIMAFLSRTEDGQWTQKRLAKEHSAVTAKCDQASRAVKARWLKSKDSLDTGVSSPYYARNTTQDPRSKIQKEREQTQRDPTPSDVARIADAMCAEAGGDPAKSMAWAAQTQLVVASLLGDGFTEAAILAGARASAPKRPSSPAYVDRVVRSGPPTPPATPPPSATGAAGILAAAERLATARTTPPSRTKEASA